jgi:hypothetical protein
MCTRLDAVLDFTIFVAREFLLRNHSLKKHQSDVFDRTWILLGPDMISAKTEVVLSPALRPLYGTPVGCGSFRLSYLYGIRVQLAGVRAVRTRLFS